VELVPVTRLRAASQPSSPSPATLQASAESQSLAR